MTTARDPERTPAAPAAPRLPPRRGGALVGLTATMVAMLGAGRAVAQAVPWGWDAGGPAKAVWSPENLADFLLTGQTPHPAVARIIAPESSGTSLGSGVLVDVNRTQGLVLTNWHVVRDSRSAVLVQFADGFQSAGTVIRWDEAWDLAALVIWKPRATPVSIAAAPPAIGEPLTIAGYGRGSYREESGPCLDYLSPGSDYPREFVELKATARQGDSGGPIFNAGGELSGVLFGQNNGRTIGSCTTRVRAFLAAVGSSGFVARPIAEFSDARAVDRGIGLAAATSERIADNGGALPRSTQVEATPALPAARPVM
ncbi:MAG: trypsin-like peptidase domain-containing protein, partial [Planctomycetes bacterium]|nr:trypsin-like peptidase domain-containing protein [Planctomycetota bacterium]